MTNNLLDLRRTIEQTNYDSAKQHIRKSTEKDFASNGLNDDPLLARLEHLRKMAQKNVSHKNLARRLQTSFVF